MATSDSQPDDATSSDFLFYQARKQDILSCIGATVTTVNDESWNLKVYFPSQDKNMYSAESRSSIEKSGAEGSSASKVATMMSAQTGLSSSYMGLFQASATASMSNAGFGEHSTYFMNEKLAFNTGYVQLLKLPTLSELSPEFKDDLLHCPPGIFLQKYGCQFVKGVALGGHMIRSFVSDTSKKIQGSSMAASADAGAKWGGGGGSFSANFSTEEKSEMGKSSINARWNVLGGDPRLFNLQEGIQKKENVKWQKTLLVKPVRTKFLTVMIWELLPAHSHADRRNGILQEALKASEITEIERDSDRRRSWWVA